MYDPLTHRAGASPEATALVDAASGESRTFAALDRGVDRTAERLAALGLDPGDRLAVAVSPRPSAVDLVHACLRTGVVIVPLSPALTEPEYRARLAAAAPAAVVCDAGAAAPVAAAAGEGTPVRSLDEASEGSVVDPLAAVEPAGRVRHGWAADDPVVIPFTSGTTGEPKPVVLTARNLLASAGASALRLGLRADDRWLATLPLHHVGGLSPVLRLPLYGTTVVLRRSFEAGPAADDLDAHGITCVSLVPTMLERMLDARGTLADSLRVVLLGGAPASAALIERCRNYSVPVHPTYGMTETASQIATATPAEAFADPGTVGRPLMGYELRVVGPDGECEPGEPGEIVVSGPTVTPGYLDRPAATAEAFDDGGLRTGDLGVVDADGRLRVLDRIDERILTGGETVDPAEVGAALTDHPAVAEAAVVGLDDPEWGERVAALVVPAAADDPPDRAALDAHAAGRLAGHKRPRVVEVVDALPRTASGTVDREAVRDRLAAGRAASADDGGSDEGADDSGFEWAGEAGATGDTGDAGTGESESPD
jgi:O-succinylbenzoic acid--CoA ligase